MSNHPQHHHILLHQEWENRICIRRNVFWWATIFLKIFNSRYFSPLKSLPPPPNLEKYLLLSFWSRLLTQRELHTGFRSSPVLTDNLQARAEGRGQSERRLCSEREVTIGKMTQCTGPLCLRRWCHVFSGVGSTGPKATEEKLLTGPASARTWEKHSPQTLRLLKVLDKILMKQTSL